MSGDPGYVPCVSPFKPSDRDGFASSLQPCLDEVRAQNDLHSLKIPKESVELRKSNPLRRQVCLDYWDPSPTTDLALCSPAFELHYFGQVICRHLFICDTTDNPIRNVTIAQVGCSALLR
jgi:hypothetical protein